MHATPPSKRLLFLSDLMLLAVAVVWGSSYGVVLETREAVATCCRVLDIW